jgi:putative glutathione S-transferase
LAQPSEYDEAGAVLVAAFTTGCWVTPFYEAGLRQVAPRAAAAHVWVAADEAGVLGVVLTPKPQYHRERLFAFNVLAVGPRGRGLNLGWQLVDHSVTLARAYGYPGLELHSSPQMTAAHQLYYRYGFVRRIDWETGVVDSGQRLLSFTYRLPESTPPDPPIPAETPPPTAWRFPTRSQEDAAMTLDPHRPAGTITPAGGFEPAPPRQPGPFTLRPGGNYRLVADLVNPRGRAALMALRLSASTVAVDVTPGTVSPELYEGSGDLISATSGTTAPAVDVGEDDVVSTPSPALNVGVDNLVSDNWRLLPQVLAEAAGDPANLYPAAERDAITDLERVIQTDLVEALERALFAESTPATQVALRLFYARLGDLDLRLSHQPYLASDHLTGADLALFAVLLGFDLGPRAHLHWAAAIVDYPALWAYARRLFHTPGLVTEADRVALGFIPGPDGTYAEPWGAPAPVEAAPDLRAEWLTPPE